jgi:hypothetical protein
MNKNNNPNYIAKLEKAIADKYGEEAIQNPKKHWDDEKEKDYQEQIKKIYKQDIKITSKNEKIEVDGILISKKLLNKEPTRRICPTCSEYSFSITDDVYMKKFDCCFKCYVKWVEGRKERWENGWRPDQNQEKT